MRTPIASKPKNCSCVSGTSAIHGGRKPPFKKHPLTIALQACAYTILGASPLAVAAPTGGAVVGGSGTISQSGTATTINQATQNLAINWNTFNVAADERVQFIQPNASAIALNTILSNNGSTIAGRIDSNGQVILVNANGIFFTATSVLNVGSIIASGLGINPAAFMNGNYVFNEIPGTSGAVINSGTINASLGGNVALIGKRVENNGLIVANLGSVTLAAGKQAVLTFDQGGLLGVRVSQEILQSELGVDPAVLNSGEIQAQGGRVLLTASQSQDVFSRAVNNAGMEPATSVVVNEDGSFTLGGADVLNSGSINTSATAAGQNGGRIVLIGENVTSSGTLRADAASGNGGEIELHANNMTLLTGNSITSARSESNGNGGIVKVLGDKVGLFDQSTVDVSGANGGGQALIGGDFQGKNTNIRNATRTYVGKDTAIYADALQQGDGGKIINWGNSYTWFYGDAFARGGSTSGNGGLVEISGKGLTFDGGVDTSAVNGAIGTVLFDPMDIVIHDGTYSPPPLSPPSNDNELNDNSIFAGDSPGTTFNISEERLEALGAGANIVLQATNNITINSLTDGTLALQQTTGSISFTADSDGVGGGSFSMNAGNTIRTQGGAVTIRGAAITAGNINTRGANGLTGGAITLTATAGDLSATSLNSSGGTAISNEVGKDAGNIGVSATNGNVSISGLVSANGSAADNGGTTARTGGNAGTVSLTGASLTIGNNISAVGGAGGNTGGLQGNGANITFTGPVTLGAPVTVNAGGLIRGDISFSSTLNGTHTLGLTGRDVTFSGAVGNTARLGDLTIDATGAVNAGVITANSLDVTQSASFISGAIDTSGGIIGAGGLVNIQSRDITVGTINTSSNVDAGGGITLAATDNAAGGAPSITLNGDINTTAAAIFANGTVQLSLNASGAGATGNITINHTTDFISPINITGSGGTDTLNAANRPNTWILTPTGPNYSGTLNAGISFSNFENLAGGTGADTVNLAGLGTYTLVLATSGFSNIENLIGGSTTTLQAHDSITNTWEVNGPNSGTLSNSAVNVAFSGFGSLDGGSGTDNFTFGPSGSFGSINGGAGNNTLTVNGTSLVTLGASNFSTASSSAGYSNIDNLVVNSTGDIIDSAAINAGVTSLTLNTPTGTITLDNQASITGGTFTANTITLVTTAGIGSLNTATANLNVTNTSGLVDITNSGTVSASVINQGGIDFVNNNGSVTIRNLDAGTGDINLTVTAGSVFGTNYIPGANANPSLFFPDIVARNFNGTVVGDFGQLGKPVTIRVSTNFVLTARRAYYLFSPLPLNPPVINADVSLSFDSIGFNGRLLEIDSLDEFDPAIFTEIRNYYYEDVAIMMPADQRLDATDEEEKDEAKEGKL